MGVKVIYDVYRDEAVLACNTNEWAFGPVFLGDAEEKAEAFLAWFEQGRAVNVADELKIRPLFGDGRDPRQYEAGNLERLYNCWHKTYIDDATGELRDFGAVPDAVLKAVE